MASTLSKRSGCDFFMCLNIIREARVAQPQFHYLRVETCFPSEQLVYCALQYFEVVIRPLPSSEEPVTIANKTGNRRVVH